MHTVGEVARLTGVSVRTLHHYEQVGLVTPQRGAANGYRLYDDSQLTRLRDVLLYRGFGFSLERIAEVLDNNTDPRTTLLEQQSLLSQQIRRLQDMQAALKKEIDAMDNGTPLTGAEKLEIFGADYDPAWEAEAEQRWGGTQAWQQSAERTKKLRKQDWIRIKQSQDELMERMADALRAGVAPDSAEGMALAEQHRHQVANFYDCTHHMHRSLGSMFVGDERFAATFNTVQDGLAHWVSQAITANADAHGAPPCDGTAWQPAQ